jgi:hypothetical protein
MRFSESKTFVPGAWNGIKDGPYGPWSGRRMKMQELNQF